MCCGKSLMGSDRLVVLAAGVTHCFFGSVACTCGTEARLLFVGIVDLVQPDGVDVLQPDDVAEQLQPGGE